MHKENENNPTSDRKVMHIANKDTFKRAFEPKQEAIKVDGQVHSISFKDLLKHLDKMKTRDKR